MATDPRQKTTTATSRSTKTSLLPTSTKITTSPPAAPVLGSPSSGGTSDALRDKLAQNLFSVADDMKAKLRVLHKSILEHEWQLYQTKLNVAMEDMKKKDVAYSALMVECEALRQKSRSSSRDEGEVLEYRKLKKEMEELYEENRALRKIVGTTDYKRSRSYK